MDYAQLVKVYGTDQSKRKSGGAKYSPAVCLSAHSEVINGSPNGEHISTSHVERANLTMRMSMRRFTRLTNALSRKVENLTAAVSLHFMHYNFCRVHKSLGTTPAVAAGITDHVWTLHEIIALLEAAEATPTFVAHTRSGRFQIDPNYRSDPFTFRPGVGGARSAPRHALAARGTLDARG